MPTIYNRLKTLRFALNRDQKVQLGKTIAEEYFKIPEKNRPFLYRKQSHEPDGTFNVWCYPQRFEAKMDLVITNFCHELGIRASRRKRIAGEKVTSSK